MLSQVLQFYDIRNAIAHSSFEHVDSFTRVENGAKVRYEAGVQFDYIDREGKIHVPDPSATRNLEHRKEIKKRNMSYDLLDERTITYSDFDEYDAQLKVLMESLVEVGGQVEPINEGINFVKDISKIIASSDNVFAFRKPSPNV